MILTAAAGDTTTSFWQQTLDKSLLFLVVLVGAAVVWLLGRWLIRILTRGIETGLPITERSARKAMRRAKLLKTVAEPTLEERLEDQRRRQRAGTVRTVLNSALAVAVLAITVMSILNILGVPVGPMIASAGVVGVALGFGAQSLVKDLLSGLFMLIEDQYGAGDIIDVGPATGVVEEVGLRAVRLRSLDGTVWYVPNGEIQRVGNMTRLWSRALLEIRFAYDTDVEAARQAMFDAVEAARENPDVDAAILGEPEVPGIEVLAYNSVTIRLLLQVSPATQWTVSREVRRQMRRIFAERGIHLAVPEGAMVVGTGRDPIRIPTTGSGHDEHHNPADPLPPEQKDE